ncbi:hypothetical protein LY76DRAFT_602755 [Colletotrichum caudatum]|nr:hypothetical protein LY76DRAFT_602755 [Colletotrichum caudatum]
MAGLRGRVSFRPSPPYLPTYLPTGYSGAEHCLSGFSPFSIASIVHTGKGGQEKQAQVSVYRLRTIATRNLSSIGPGTQPAVKRPTPHRREQQLALSQQRNGGEGNHRGMNVQAVVDGQKEAGWMPHRHPSVMQVVPSATAVAIAVAVAVAAAAAAAANDPRVCAAAAAEGGEALGNGTVASSAALGFDCAPCRDYRWLLANPLANGRGTTSRVFGIRRRRDPIEGRYTTPY